MSNISFLCKEVFSPEVKDVEEFLRRYVDFSVKLRMIYENSFALRSCVRLACSRAAGTKRDDQE